MSEPSEKKKYNNFENVLQYINKKTISLSDDEEKQNNNIQNKVVGQVIDKMKAKSTLFKTLYKEIFYGGSYYDGLKTTKPDEYDLDLLFHLPKDVQVEIKSIPDYPGFVSLHVKGNTMSLKDFLDEENFFSPDKVLRWMESLLSKTLREFPSSENKYIAQYDDETKFYMYISKSGPAFTLKLNGMLNEKPVSFDVDLVPCFCFDDAHWPKDFRQNNTKEKTFFLVPKKPKNAGTEAGVCWRLSFQKQERSLINDTRVLKPSLRLLKKLRDKLQHVCISSYFIKTVFLWEVSHREKTFWDNSLSFVYMEMLKSYMSYIEDKNIPYFWNEGNNLLRDITESTLQNVANRLKKIYNDLNKNLDDPYFVAKLYLSEDEIEVMKEEIILSTKKCNNALENIETIGRRVDESYESLMETMKKMSEDLVLVKSKLYSLERCCQQTFPKKQIIQQNPKNLTTRINYPLENQSTDDDEPGQSVSLYSGLPYSGYPRVQKVTDYADRGLDKYTAGRQLPIEREVSNLSSSLGYLGVAAGTMAAIGGIFYALTRNNDPADRNGGAPEQRRNAVPEQRRNAAPEQRRNAGPESSTRAASVNAASDETARQLNLQSGVINVFGLRLETQSIILFTSIIFCIICLLFVYIIISFKAGQIAAETALKTCQYQINSSNKKTFW